MLLALIGSSLAGWPDDVDLSALAYNDGVLVTDPATNTPVYDTVVSELGAAVANKPLVPADTLGINGFEVGLASTLAFTSSRDPDFGDLTDWDRVTSDGESSRVMVIPWVMVRKGLPMSIDVGANMGWIGMSRQTVIGGYGRIAPLEGYDQAPDVAFQVGYSGYIGNNQLELGALDWSGTLSYELPFGSLMGINSASFTPFAGAGMLITHAQPRLGAEEMATLGIRAVSGFKGSEAYDPTDTQWRKARIHGGFRIVSRSFHVRFGADWVPQVMPTLSAGLGFTY
jgi:hypothetical protein